MTLLKFEYNGDVLEFIDGSDYPAKSTTELFQVQDRTAAGTVQIENLGITTGTRTLNFTLMTTSDYNMLMDWFLYTVNGGEKEFNFTDEYGITKPVRFISDKMEFTETYHNRHSGRVILEYV